MDNSLKTKEKPLEAGGASPPVKGKTKLFLIGKELKTNTLRHTAAERGNRPTTKPNPKPESKPLLATIACALPAAAQYDETAKSFHLLPPDSLRPGASQAAGAAPTLRYGPAGDSAPRLRLKASSMAERFPFGPAGAVRSYTKLSNDIHSTTGDLYPPFPS